MKHIFVLETTNTLSFEGIKHISNFLLEVSKPYSVAPLLATQSNQPDDDILVIPNATKSGEPRYTAI
jgi:hypothetical protein